jgi:hypothetical protein
VTITIEREGTIITVRATLDVQRMVSIDNTSSTKRIPVPPLSDIGNHRPTCTHVLSIPGATRLFGNAGYFVLVNGTTQKLLSIVCK